MSVTAVGLKETIGWFERLEKNIPPASRRAVGGPDALNALVGQARSIVESVIYSKFEGTKATLNAIAADASERGAVLFMNLTSETATKAGDEAGENVYAMFMLPGFYTVGKGSFLRGAAFAKLPLNFYEVWHKNFEEQCPEWVATELDKELAKK